MKQTHQEQSQISDLSFASSPSTNIQNANFQLPSTSINCTLVASLFFLGFYFLIFMIVQLITNYQQTSYIYTLTKNNNIYSTTTDFISFQTDDTVSIYLQFPEITQMDVNYLSEPFANNVEKFHSIDCGKFSTNEQIGKTVSMLGSALNATDRALPCGYFTSFYPDGTFQIINTETNQQLIIDTRNLPNFQTQIQQINPVKQWTDINTERFKQWNQNHASIIPIKHWGVISGAVSGTFLIQLTLSNSILYKGDINLRLSNNGALAGYNPQFMFLNLFYAIASFSGSLISFVVNVPFLSTQKKYGKKVAIKQKNQSSGIFGQSNQIKVYLSSGNSTPGVKFE